MPVVAPHVRGVVGPEVELRHPGVVVGHVVPLPDVSVEPPSGGEVGGVAVAKVPLADLSTVPLFCLSQGRSLT